MFKKLKGWRTLAFNGAAAVAPVIDLVQQTIGSGGADEAVRAFIPPQYLPLYALVVTIGNAVLRFQTDTKVGAK